MLKNCPVWNGSKHEFSFKGKDGDSITIMVTRLTDSSQLYAGTDSEKMLLLSREG